MDSHISKKAIIKSGFKSRKSTVNSNSAQCSANPYHSFGSKIIVMKLTKKMLNIYIFKQL